LRDNRGRQQTSVERRRTLARSLDEIAAEVIAALNDAGIRIPIFFSIPSSGASYLTLATPLDPTHEEWERVCEIVCRIVASEIDMPMRSRELSCVAAGVQMGAADLATEAEVAMDTEPLNND
jgi:hypothetical protein